MKIRSGLRRGRHCSILLLAAAVGGVAALKPAVAAGQISFLNAWGSAGSGNGQFNDPTGVAVGPTGTVYVADFFNGRVEAFNSSGGFLSSFGSLASGNGQLVEPQGVAVSSTGTVYVVDTSSNNVEVFNSAGNYQSTFGGIGANNGQFEGPQGAAVDSNGNVYVTDDGNDRVQIFNSSGTFQSTFGTGGSNNGQFEGPGGVAVAPNGNLYVADESNSRVEVFNSAGLYQSQFYSTGGNTQFDYPAGVAVGSPGTVYVADAATDRIDVFNSSDVYESSFGGYGTGNGQFNGLAFVAVAPTGMIYATDLYNNRVERFFDPGSWVSGTNTFTDPSLGPTSLGVGLGQVLGTSLTVNSSMGLIVGNTLSVLPGGSLTQSGGLITTTTFLIDSSFNYQGGGFYSTSTFLNSGGSLTASAFTIGAGQTLTQNGGTFSVNNLTVSGNYAYSGGTFTTPSSIVVTPGGSFTGNIGLNPVNQTVSVSGGPITVGVFGASTGGLFEATQGGELTATQGLIVAYSGEVILDGGASVTCGTVSMQGGLLVLGDATLSVPVVAGNMPFRIFSGAEVQLENANTSILQTPQLLNEGGLLDGSGRINGQLENYAGAEVSVATGQVMAITGAGNYNQGLFSLTGGELHFTQDLTNYGSVEGYGTLRVDGGLTNYGLVSVGGAQTGTVFGPITNNANFNLAGSTYVFGNLTNAAAGTMHLSGNTPNVFYGTVANSGALNVDAGAIGLLYGAYSGSGPIVNNGFLYVDATSVAGKVTGGGTLTIGAAGLPANLTLLNSGITSAQSGLTINPGSALDITNNTLAINFGSPAADPAALIRADLQAGYNGDKWNGPGIISTNAQANPGLYAVGYVDGNTDGGTPAAANQILIKNTIAGDANLDGLVNFSDLLLVAQDYGRTGQDWGHGDFNYDGLVNFSDLLLVAQNYGKQLSGGQLAQLPGSFSAQWQLAEAEVSAAQTNSVPEPATMSLLAISAAGLLAQRRRRRARGL